MSSMLVLEFSDTPPPNTRPNLEDAEQFMIVESMNEIAACLSVMMAPKASSGESDAAPPRALPVEEDIAMQSAKMQQTSTDVEPE
eukprot:6959414-Prymnesium_polylepis.1